MISTRKASGRGDGGAAIIEYVLMIVVLVTGIGIGIKELDRGTESGTRNTAAGIAGDPYSPNSTTTIPSGTSSIPGSSTTQLQVQVNTAPKVIVPPFTEVELDTAMVIPVVLRTLISDDTTPLDLMDITITWTTGLAGDGSFVYDYVNTPGEWIEHTHFGPKPGVYVVEVCAFDGILEGCGTGRVKVSPGTVTVETKITWWDYNYGSWLGWIWGVGAEFYVRDELGNLITYDDVRVDYTFGYEFDDGNGIETVGGPGTCYTGTRGRCGMSYNWNKGTGINEFSTVEAVTGDECVIDWDGLNATTAEASPLGPQPTWIPTTTVPSSTSSSSTTVAPTTVAPTTAPTTVAPTTTFRDNT